MDGDGRVLGRVNLAYVADGSAEPGYGVVEHAPGRSRPGRGSAPEPRTVPGPSQSVDQSVSQPTGQASLLRFGPLPAASTGGASGSAAFSSPRKVNFAVSPSPSTSTTTM